MTDKTTPPVAMILDQAKRTISACVGFEFAQGELQTVNGSDLLAIYLAGKSATDVPLSAIGGKTEEFEPHGWAQTDGPAINAFTQEWDIAEDWAKAGYGTVELLNKEHVDEEIKRLSNEHHAQVVLLTAQLVDLMGVNEAITGQSASTARAAATRLPDHLAELAQFNELKDYVSRPLRERCAERAALLARIAELEAQQAQ